MRKSKFPRLVALLAFAQGAAFAEEPVREDTTGTATAHVGEIKGKTVAAVPVVFKTPETGTTTKTLVVIGEGFDPALNGKMTSDIAASTPFDNTQWLKGTESGFTHPYSITAVHSGTPLAIVVTGALQDDKKIEVKKTASKDAKPPKHQMDFAVTAPYAAIVTHKTVFAAQNDPQNKDFTRLTIGVGEVIEFDVPDTHLGHPSVSVDMQAGGIEVGGKPATPLTPTKKFTFRSGGMPSPEKKPFKITLTFGAKGVIRRYGESVTGQTMDIFVTILAPTGETVAKNDPQKNFNFPSGEAGVGLELIYRPLPATVNFQNVEVREVGEGTAGDGKDPDGYFVSLKNIYASALRHNPATKPNSTEPLWIKYEGRHCWWDDAAWCLSQAKGIPPAKMTAMKAVPYAPGRFHWTIPVVWRCFGSGEQPMYSRTQLFEMFATNGSMRVSKNGTSGVMVKSDTRIP